MKKVKIELAETIIDWSKKQWVLAIADCYKNQVVLVTSSDKNSDTFSGVVLPCINHPEGQYRTDWCKSAFKALDFDIPFIISNAD